MVDTDGEIFHFYHPAATLDPEGACKVGETEATRIHITEEISDQGLWDSVLATVFYDGHRVRHQVQRPW